GCSLFQKTVDTPAPEEAPKTETEEAAVFPDGVIICGVDVAGMTAEEAKAAVESSSASYVLTLAIGEEEIAVTGEEMELVCGETDYEMVLESCLEDEAKRDIIIADLITYSEESFANALTEKAGGEEGAKNAYIEYDEEKQEFVVVPEELGEGINAEAVLAAVKEVDAIARMLPVLEIEPEVAYQAAEITEDSPEVQEALEKANAYLDVALTYTYSPKNADPATETIGRELISKWLVVEEDGLTVTIDPGPLNEYVASMDEAHSIASSTSQFKTTGGSYIDIRVPSPGQTVDVDKLYNDIFDCIENLVSGEREAPYVESDEESGENFGGNYVEINLSSQHVWVYSDGECVVSTDIVSGCVNTGHATPTGLYSIQAKETARYLIGPGYKSWVDYWMPFNGGIGLHDAQWRWSFGGSIYLYSGSHGCINMPLSAARTTYSVVSVGTKVVVYGGTSSVAALNNSIGGTGSYTVNEGDAAFTLDAAPAKSTNLTYTSSNPSVVTVSASGVVTIVGPGTATITVTAAAIEGYTAATKTISITVKGKCSSGQHAWDEGRVTKESTCSAAGVKTFTCSSCGATQTQELPLAEHAWDGGTVTAAPTCNVDGVKTYTCGKCGATKTEAIPATNQHI
ncbi:MAG: L,D-transpeptidase family protein, partial [Oscillospiraceae bacterium]|nr:L,D-transpeptidase family protein [Oscillospiraceae bacterium]